MKKYIEKTDIGEMEVIEQSNGIKIKQLKKPNAKYRAKLKKMNDEQKKHDKERDEKLKKEKIIKQRMREIALRELREEGLIDE